MLMSTCFDAFCCTLFLVFFHVSRFFSLGSCQCLLFFPFFFLRFLTPSTHTHTMPKTMWAIEKIYLKKNPSTNSDLFRFSIISLNSDNISRRYCAALAHHRNGVLVHELFGRPNGGHSVQTGLTFSYRIPALPLQSHQSIANVFNKMCGVYYEWLTHLLFVC